MNNFITLNGDDWCVTGWWKNQWRLNNSMELDIPVNAQVGPVQATVPGAVQTDLIREGLLPDPDYGLNSNLGEWVNNREWIYQKSFTLSHEMSGYERYFLRFEGLDFHGEIHLNGTKLTEFSGMFVPVEIDVTGILRGPAEENILKVVFYQTPEVDGQIGYSNRINTIKSRFNYVWDWCPRIVPVGIWEDVSVICVNRTRILDFFPKARVCSERYSESGEDVRTGEVTINLDIDAYAPGNYSVVYSITPKNDGKSSDTETVTEKIDGAKGSGTSETRLIETGFNEKLTAGRQSVVHTLQIDDPSLWWPNGEGDQPLYDIEVTILDENVSENESHEPLCDRAHRQIGFKKAEFVQNFKAPTDARPYTLTFNDRRVFLRGVNWVPLSPFYGSVTREQYRNYLRRFKDMNCNILRVWGGAILEKRDFYELCDEMGLMVWQEFPQSSSGINNSPPENPAFLKELEKVASIYCKKRRHHVSHLLWCGGNELMWEGVKPINEHHINIGMLNNVVKRLDPEKYFLPSSSSGPYFQAEEERFGKGVHHDVHGPWKYLGEPAHYRYLNGDDSLFRSETGCPGISRKETLEKYLSGADHPAYVPWPPDHSNPYWTHRGSWWIQLEELTRLFGPWPDDGSELDTYIQASRFLQAEALRYDIESLRRREPESSGFIIWMGNEPFPNNANTSVIEYDGTPKPAYYWVKECYSPLHVSARYDKLRYSSGESIETSIYLHRDRPDFTRNSGKDRTGDTNRSYCIRAAFVDLQGTVLTEKTWKVPLREKASDTDHMTCDTERMVTPVLLGTIQWQTQKTEGTGGETVKGSVDGNVLFLRATVSLDADVISENTYLFTVDCGTVDCDYPLQPLRTLPKATLEIRTGAEQTDVEQTSDEKTRDGKILFSVTNTASVAAVGVFLSDKDPKRFTLFGPGYLVLFPGESKIITKTVTAGKPQTHMAESSSQTELLEAVKIEGFNVDSLSTVARPL